MALDLQLQQNGNDFKVVGTSVINATQYVGTITVEVPGLAAANLQSFSNASTITPSWNLNPDHFSKFPQGTKVVFQGEAQTSAGAHLERGTLDISSLIPPPAPAGPQHVKMTVTAASAKWPTLPGAHEHQVELFQKYPSGSRWYISEGFEPPKTSRQRVFTPGMVPWDEIPTNSELKLKVTTVDSSQKPLIVSEGELDGWERPAEEEEDEDSDEPPTPPVTPAPQNKPLWKQWQFWAVLIPLVALVAYWWFTNRKDSASAGDTGDSGTSQVVTSGTGGSVKRGGGLVSGGKSVSLSTDSKFATLAEHNGNGDIIVYNGVNGGPHTKIRDSRPPTARKVAEPSTPAPKALEWPEGFNPTITNNVAPCPQGRASSGTTIRVPLTIPGKGKIQFNLPDDEWHVDPIMPDSAAGQYKFAILMNKDGKLQWVDPDKTIRFTSNDAERTVVKAYGFELLGSAPLSFEMEFRAK